jgi:hypothetical protein
MTPRHQRNDVPGPGPGQAAPTTRRPRRTSPAVVGIIALLAACSCRGDPARDQASTLVRLVNDLREAPNPAKRGPLDRLKSMTCSFPDVCEAQAACVDAFQHHVHGIELGAQLHAVDASAPDQDESAGLAMRLLEMNLEIEEGKARMPLCEEKMAALRVAHKV